MEEATPVLVTATCRTPDCPVQDIGYTVDVYGPPFTVVCAQCGQPVTDLVSAA
jgi:hypothetical protein